MVAGGLGWRYMQDIDLIGKIAPLHGVGRRFDPVSTHHPSLREIKGLRVISGPFSLSAMRAEHILAVGPGFYLQMDVHQNPGLRAQQVELPQFPSPRWRGSLAGIVMVGWMRDSIPCKAYFHSLIPLAPRTVQRRTLVRLFYCFHRKIDYV